MRLLGSTSSNPSRTKRTFDWFSRMNLKKHSLAWSSISSGKIWSSIASQMLDWISLHLRSSSTSISGKDGSHLSFLVAQSYASFWQYVVFPMPGSPSIKIVLGLWHSACALKIAVILVISSVSTPWVFSLPEIFNLVKISFKWKLKSSHQGTGRRRCSRVLYSWRILSKMSFGYDKSKKWIFIHVAYCENIHFSSLFAAGDVSHVSRNVPAAKSEEKRMFSQAIIHTA